MEEVPPLERCSHSVGPTVTGSVWSCTNTLPCTGHVLRRTKRGSKVQA
jgi:hypothetical protein